MGQVYTTDTSWTHDEWSPHEWNDSWSLDERNDDLSCVGWREDCEQTHDTSVRSFSLESSEFAGVGVLFVSKVVVCVFQRDSGEGQCDLIRL